MTSSTKPCISSAAGSRAPKRRGSSRRPACPWCCTRCGRCAAPRRIRPTSWPSWSAPIPSAPTMPQNNAVGLLHEEMRRAGSLIMRAADAHKLPAGGALAVDRHGFSAAVQQALLAHPLVEHSPRGSRRPAAGRLGQRDHRHRPPDLRRRWPRRSAKLTGEEVARLLRRHRAHRASREHRSCRSPGSSRATTRAARRRRRRLHQLPAGQGAVRRLRRGACWRATRPSSRSGKRPRPTSRAASRSR